MFDAPHLACAFSLKPNGIPFGLLQQTFLTGPKADDSVHRIRCSVSLRVEMPYLQLSQRLDELVTAGAVTPQRRANAEVAAFSAVHGYSMLLLDGPFRDLPASDRAAGLEEVLRVVRSGI